MQRAVNTTIEEEVFSVWFPYIHCWVTDVFSVGPPRDYVSKSEISRQASYTDRAPAACRRSANFSG
jgi:hypothetical protein